MSPKGDSKVQTAAGKRLPPNAGKGRVAGVPNKNTKALKDMILGALEQGGGQAWLVKQMEENPGPFMTLVGKVLPMTITGGTNADGSDSPLIVHIHAGPKQDG